MAKLVTDNETVESPAPVVIQHAGSSDAVNMVGRFVAVVAAAVFTIIGAIALAKFNWSPLGFDAPAVSVAGMVFRPWVAVATVVLGVLALAAAVSWDRESKLFMGAILVAAGIAIVVATPTVEGIALNNRMGWMAILVGAILAIVGLIAGQSWASRRVSRADAGYA
jgi:phosphatidylserine synthase